MAYRDELEAAQARAEALERELADARKELAVVKGGSSTALVARDSEQALVVASASQPAQRRWLGAPTRLELERQLDGELPESAQTEMVEAIRRALGTVGSTTVLPGSLAWTANAPSNGIGPFINVYITYRDGTTTIRLDQRLGNLAGGIFGGVGGGVGGGGIGGPIALGLINPILIPVGLGLWLGGTYFACRKIYRSRVKKHAARLEELLDDLASIAERRIAESSE